MSWNRVPCGESGHCVEYMRVPCGSTECVEVGQEDGDFLMRSSERPDKVVTLSRDEMVNFVEAVKNGWLDDVL